MMARYPQDGLDFCYDMHRLDPSWRSSKPRQDWADELGAPLSTFRNLVAGHNRYTPERRAHLERLIAAKANEPMGFTPTDPNPPMIIDDVSRQHPRFVRVGREVHCEVVVRTDKIATFASEGAAEEYAEWRNQEEDQ